MFEKEIEEMTKEFDRLDKIKRAKKKFGPVVGYYYNGYYARIDADDRLKKIYTVSIKINKISKKESFLTIDEAKFYLKKMIKKNRLFLLY